MKTRTSRRLIVLSVATVAAAVIVADVYVRHHNDSAAALRPVTADSVAASPDKSSEVTSSLVKQGVPLDGVSVTWVDGIVILRGSTASKESNDRIVDAVRTAGFTRVANLLQVKAAPDDDAIKRDTERKLAFNRSLDGCKFSVSAENGVLRVGGVVPSDNQEAAARAILKNVRGPREIHAEFRRF